MEYWQRDEENTDNVILLVVPSDQASIFREREGSCFDSVLDKSIETLGHEGLRLSAVLESAESSQKEVGPDLTHARC